MRRRAGLVEPLQRQAVSGQSRHWPQRPLLREVLVAAVAGAAVVVRIAPLEVERALDVAREDVLARETGHSAQVFVEERL